MEDKDVAAAEKNTPESTDASGALSEDELNNVAGGVAVHTDTFHPGYGTDILKG